MHYINFNINSTLTYVNLLNIERHIIKEYNSTIFVQGTDGNK